MYATVADLRAEGVTPAMASDERLASLIVEACAFIDHALGWFFEPRRMVVRMDGRGSPTIEPSYPPIALDSLYCGHTPISLDPEDLEIVGAPIAAGFDAPRITILRSNGLEPHVRVLLHGCVFHQGRGNVVASGVWGYTEPDGTPMGRTPMAIRRAAMLLAMRYLSALGGGSGAPGVSQWRVIEERTRDQSYRLSQLAHVGPVFTGDPELDWLLVRFRRPAGLGAA